MLLEGLWSYHCKRRELHKLPQLRSYARPVLLLLSSSFRLRSAESLVAVVHRADEK